MSNGAGRLKVTAMIRFSLAVLMLFTPAQAAEPSDCSVTQLKTTRRAAAKLARAQDFTAVVALLAPRVKACPVESEDGYWLIDTLARARLQTGDAVECRRLLAPLLYPGPASEGLLDTNLEGSEIEEALARTLGECTEAEEKARESLKADACAFSLSPRPAAIVAVPASLLPAEAPKTCLVLTSPDAKVSVVSQREPGARDQQLLARGDDDPLKSPDRSCNARTLRVGTWEGKRAVLVGGRGRRCKSAGVEEIAVWYEWTESDGLRFWRDDSVSLR